MKYTYREIKKMNEHAVSDLLENGLVTYETAREYYLRSSVWTRNLGSDLPEPESENK